MTFFASNVSSLVTKWNKPSIFSIFITSVFSRIGSSKNSDMSRKCSAYSLPVGCSTFILKAGEIPIAIEFRSSIPIELLGNDGVMKRVSSGHEEKEWPTVSRSTISRLSIPACAIAIPTPIPAAPAPTIMTSYSPWPSSEAVSGTPSMSLCSLGMPRRKLIAF